RLQNYKITKLLTQINMFTISLFTQRHWKALSLMIALTFIAWLTVTQTNLFRGNVIEISGNNVVYELGFKDPAENFFVYDPMSVRSFTSNTVKPVIRFAGNENSNENISIDIEGEDFFVNEIWSLSSEHTVYLADEYLTGEGEFNYNYSAILTLGDYAGVPLNFNIRVELINSDGGDGDDPDFTDDPSCGDGIIQLPEECDPPGSTGVISDGSTYVCDANCKISGGTAGDTDGTTDDGYCLVVTKVAEHSIAGGKNIEIWFRPEGPHRVTTNVGEVEEMKMTDESGTQHTYYMLRNIPTIERMGHNDYSPYTDSAIIVSVDDLKVIEIGQRHVADLTWDSYSLEDFTASVEYAGTAHQLIKIISAFVIAASN
ncbi:MAG: hypothetical protein KAR20_05405, partial [Candidatus Heimdallarchaeota archaeon]|nr:hypothetical protein [Candidatus Heimdallarchaeota archaeon]